MQWQENNRKSFFFYNPTFTHIWLNTIEKYFAPTHKQLILCKGFLKQTFNSVTLDQFHLESRNNLNIFLYQIFLEILFLRQLFNNKKFSVIIIKCSTNFPKHFPYY